MTSPADPADQPDASASSGGLLRPLYDRTMRLAGHRRAMPALAGISFIESSVFPIPPDVMLIPMVLADRSRAWLIALVCTLASVAGGLFGYAIGFFLWETVGQPVLAFYGKLEAFDDFQGMYNDAGAWIVFFAGITPFPYKVITIASGVTQLDLAVFTAASVAARGLRFFLVAALLWWFGPPIRAFIEKRLGLLFVVFCVLLVGGFVAARYML
jgi:membrane protein YqaA with SNARE-associated domain